MEIGIPLKASLMVLIVQAKSVLLVMSMNHQPEEHLVSYTLQKLKLKQP